jgi:hypothetical protein
VSGRGAAVKYLFYGDPLLMAVSAIMRSYSGTEHLSLDLEGPTYARRSNRALGQGELGAGEDNAAEACSGESGCVQVFGRRHDDPFHALWRPASKKRQGTKSREVGHWRGSGAMGI